ncbi:MAG: methanogenesis marker 17 protein [Thermoplasmatales archaeon]|nr:methanogenesis marker 17 protein [Thermoplasmatales archaeon]
METVIEGTEEFGNDAYKALFEGIMSDIGKAVHVEKARLVLRPEVPFFVFSLLLKAEPESKRISDVASVRGEDGNVFVTISDERYAPEVLSRLWARYSRERVEQQTRFDIAVRAASVAEVEETVVSSGEEALREIVGALWRSMPEGIKARHNMGSGRVVTIMATEENVQPWMKEEAAAVHASMGG